MAQYVCMQPPTILLFDQLTHRWLAFHRPAVVLTASALEEVVPALHEADRRVRDDGLWAAGFVSYEAAPAFDPAHSTHPPGALPLLWLGLFPPPKEAAPPPAPPPIPALSWRIGQAEPAYTDAIGRIKDQIARGNTYQVNYTLRLHAPFSGDAWDFFCGLARRQPGGPAAFVNAGRFAVCSASPELFFTLDGDRLTSRPMKGTAPRGLWTAQDDENAAWLAASEKNRAENVMIVDMVRNDMGRIARTGSVHVPALFAVERYPTVLQMTSTVACRTDASIPQIFSALFPCASITGAPKIRTMQIIRGLEPEARGVYTGAIGYWGPERRAQFSVAIRTAVIDRELGLAEYGTGSGIVWDSDAATEYQECRLKAELLTAPRPDFALLESLRWSAAEGYFLLERHLERLASSAERFGFPFDEPALRRALASAPPGPPAGVRKVRLLLDAEGGLRLESEPLPADGRTFSALLTPAETSPLHYARAPEPVEKADVLLYHKTSRRALYEAARAACPEAEEVLLWNEAGEATEFTAANLVVRRGEDWITPPVGCGLLPGVLRAELIRLGRIREQVIRLEELETADQIWAINSVRGWRRLVQIIST